MPIHLGGLGLKFPEEILKSSYFTRAQSLVAGFLLKNPSRGLLSSRKEYSSSDVSVKLGKDKYVAKAFGPQLKGLYLKDDEELTISNSSISVESVSRFCPLRRRDFFEMCDRTEGLIYKDKKFLRNPEPVYYADRTRETVITEIVFNYFHERESDTPTPIQIDTSLCFGSEGIEVPL